MVQVKFNNVEQALKKLKKYMQIEGIFRAMRNRRHYEKPSEIRMRKMDESRRRCSKIANRGRNYN